MTSKLVAQGLAVGHGKLAVMGHVVSAAFLKVHNEQWT